MHHLPLVLVVIAVTLAGSVWYLPAVQTLRAGQDRPRSARLNAAASLAWWGTGPVVAAALLFAPAAAGATALSLGALISAALRIRAVHVRYLERRAHDRLWAQLGETPGRPDPARYRRGIVAWALAAVAATVLTAAALVAFGDTAAAVLVVTGLAAAAAAAIGSLTIHQHTAPGAGSRAGSASPHHTPTDPTSQRRRQPR